jgi:putative ABC transport system permease protein
MNWLRRLLHKSRAEGELDKELRFHFEQQVADGVAAGMSPEEARRRAQQEFGGLERVKEEVRDARWETYLYNFLQDFRYALRIFRKDRRFAFIAILTLALGIGTTTSIFSIVDGALLEPFPYKNISRVVNFHVHFLGGAEENDRYFFPATELLAFRQQNLVFDDMFGIAGMQVLYPGRDGAERVVGSWITPNAFEILGVPPLLGRPITSEDGKPNSPPIFVMSYSMWTREFHSDPAILGKPLTLNGEPRTLVAVMPPRFRFGDCAPWIPVTLENAASGQNVWERGPFFWSFGLLKTGLSEKAAAADLDAAARRVAKAFPGGYLREFAVIAQSYPEVAIGDVRNLLLALMASVGMLLLISCSNVANLLLSRSTSRAREIAIRASIGASHGRIFRQILVESFVLAAAGCLLGCWFSYFGLNALVAAIPRGTIPEEAVVRFSPLALLFAITVTLLVTLLCGVAPALHLLHSNVDLQISGGAKGSGCDLRHGSLRSGLVIAEVALSLALLTGSGLMMRTLFALKNVRLGIDPTNTLYLQVHHANNYASPQQKWLFLRAAIDRVQALPGVRSVGLAVSVPPYSTGLTDVLLPGRAKPEGSYAESELCSENYFRTLGISLLRGQEFSQRDIDSARRVVVVNQAFVRSFIGREEPLGKKLRFPAWETNYTDWPRDADFEIIGVVADVKNKGLREIEMAEIYLPFTITATGLADDRVLLVKTATEPHGMLPHLRATIHELDRNVDVTDSGTLEEFLWDDSYAQPRFGLITISVFAGVGLLLVLLGIFSVMTYTVSLRTHEIGIRMALGAQRWEVSRMVLRNGLSLVGVGTVVGILSSVVLSRLFTSQIWGVSATDPWTFVAVVVLIQVVGLTACLLPAHRATRVDPMMALRDE